MNTAQTQSRKERREAAKELTVSTWHAGKFGCWRWADLTEQEQKSHVAAQQRNQYVQNFGVYA